MKFDQTKTNQLVSAMLLIFAPILLSTTITGSYGMMAVVGVIELVLLAWAGAIMKETGAKPFRRVTR